MHLRATFLLVAATALVALPVSAAVNKTFSWQSENHIFQPSVVGGNVVIAPGTWEGPQTHVDITIDNPAAPTTSTVQITEWIVHNNVNQGFLCIATSGVHGCVADVSVDTVADFTGGAVFGTLVGTGTDSSLSGPRYHWGPDPSTLPVAAIVAPDPRAGQGQLCHVDIDEAIRQVQMEADPGVGNTYVPATPTEVAALQAWWCGTVLGLSQDVWVAPGIPPLPNIDSGLWHFNPTMDAFEAPSGYMYFDLQPAFAVWGETHNATGAWPRSVNVSVPLLAPLGALALGGSLVFMGWNTLRRKND